MFMYSAGLRVGEVVKLRVEDVERRLIRIRGGKGRKKMVVSGAEEG